MTFRVVAKKLAISAHDLYNNSPYYFLFTWITGNIYCKCSLPYIIRLTRTLQVSKSNNFYTHTLPNCFKIGNHIISFWLSPVQFMQTRMAKLWANINTGAPNDTIWWCIETDTRMCVSRVYKDRHLIWPCRSFSM